MNLHSMNLGKSLPVGDRLGTLCETLAGQILGSHLAQFELKLGDETHGDRDVSG